MCLTGHPADCHTLYLPRMTAPDDPTSPAPRNGGSRPVPDPTALTDRAIDRLRDELTRLIDLKGAVLTTRIDGTEALTAERFKSAENLRIEQKADTKGAVDAALSAAKEAVKEQTTASERSIDKSETGTRDQLKGLDVKIDDLKERVGRIESVKLGATETRAISADNRGAYIGAAGVAIAGIGVAIAFALANAPTP